MSMGDSLSSMLILEVGEAEILPPWTGVARGGVLPAKSNREDLKTEWHEIIGPRKWEMNVSKGEIRTTLRVVLKSGIGLASEQVTPNMPTTIVTHNSPFEGGSRGMSFGEEWYRKCILNSGELY
jgi:hypothetical protein